MTACAVCDEPILKSEPRKTISGQLMHRYCDTEGLSGVCDTPTCAWRWCAHAGACS